MKWEDYCTRAVDLIEARYTHKNRQWCRSQLNKALDNTDFPPMDGLRCDMLDEILACEFDIVVTH